MIRDPFFIPPKHRKIRPALGFYGLRPKTWGEWRSATFYTDRLVKG